LLRKIPCDNINELFDISLSLVQLFNFLGTIEIEPFDKPVEHLPERSTNRTRLLWVN